MGGHDGADRGQSLRCCGLGGLAAAVLESAVEQLDREQHRKRRAGRHRDAEPGQLRCGGDVRAQRQTDEESFNGDYVRFCDKMFDMLA